MKLAIILLTCCVGVSCAQDRKENPGPGNTPRTEAKGEKKRLESVTWDLTTHKLIWVVQSGPRGPNGEFISKTSERYEISPDDATMAVKNEKRGFTDEEAASLHRLLDTLSLYCVESVVWWDRGMGDPIDANGQRIKKKEAVPEPHRTPRRRVPSGGTLIGANLSPR